MTSNALRIPAFGPSRLPARRRTDPGFRPAPEGTPVVRLVQIALLGWFGVMLLVTALAL